MRKHTATSVIVNLLLLVLTSTNYVYYVYAAEEPLPSRFLGSPLLILTAIIMVDIIAYLYRKIRKVKV